MIPALDHGSMCEVQPAGRALPGRAAAAGAGHQAGQGGNPDGDTSVCGQRPVHEGELVGHRPAARSRSAGAAQPLPPHELLLSSVNTVGERDHDENA